MGKRKTNEASSESDSDVSTIDVDFDFHNPNPTVDYHAIKHLLTQLFNRDAETFHLHELTELILSQPTIGTTIKTDGEESDPYALLTVLNMHQHKDHPSIKALASYFLSKSSSNPNFHSSLQNLFSQTENHVGFIVCERLINMPVQVIPPMYRMLIEELKREVSEGHPFKFSHFIIVSRTYHLSMEEETYLSNSQAKSPSTKRTKKSKAANAQISRPADGIYSFHPEDEYIKQASIYSVDYTFSAAPPEPRDSESFGLDTRGRMMLVPVEQLESLAQKMNEVYTVN